MRDAILGPRILPVKGAMIVFQGDYVKSLISETDYPSFDIDGVNLTFLESERHKHDNIMTFRDHGYRSLMIGTMAPRHHTPWLDAMDDSLEAYLAQPETVTTTDKTADTDTTTTPLVS